MTLEAIIRLNLYRIKLLVSQVMHHIYKICTNQTHWVLFAGIVFCLHYVDTKCFLTLNRQRLHGSWKLLPSNFSGRILFSFLPGTEERPIYIEERPRLLVSATRPQQSQTSMLNCSAVAAICPEKIQNVGHFQYPHAFQSTILAWTLIATVCVYVLTRASCWCIKFTLKKYHLVNTAK